MKTINVSEFKASNTTDYFIKQTIIARESDGSGLKKKSKSVKNINKKNNTIDTNNTNNTTCCIIS